ncbi:ADP-ribosylation factor-like protein 8B, partial [Arapaima gigas]
TKARRAAPGGLRSPGLSCGASTSNGRSGGGCSSSGSAWWLGKRAG